LWVIYGLSVGFAAKFQHFLRLIKKFLCYDWLVLSFVDFTTMGLLPNPNFLKI
jgi:hypothetical protein